MPSYQQPFPQWPPQDTKAKSDQDSTVKWIVTGIVVPLVVACIGAGVLLITSHNNLGQPTPTVPPGITSTFPVPPTATTVSVGGGYPQLHARYGGSLTNTANSATASISISNIGENSNDGMFTADSELITGCGSDQVCDCLGSIMGTVKTNGGVAFMWTYGGPDIGSYCASLYLSFQGNIQNDESITGTWSNTSGTGSGAFTLS